MISCLNTIYLFIILLFDLLVICDTVCSREESRYVREYFTHATGPIYDKHQLKIPSECIFSSKRDIYYDQELNKIRVKEKWLCNYCQRTYHTEYQLDLHLSNRHNDTLNHDENAICLADYCSIFRCDVFKRSKKAVHSLSFKYPRKHFNEEQLIILRNRCTSIINQCIPHNLPHDQRTQIQHEFYAEICAFLTNKKYFQLPNYRKSLINLTSAVCLTLFVGLCFIIFAFIKHFDWRRFSQDHDESHKHLSDETISIATALLSKSPSSSIIHTSKHPSTSTIRHRVRFQSLDD